MKKTSCTIAMVAALTLLSCSDPATPENTGNTENTENTGNTEEPGNPGGNTPARRFEIKDKVLYVDGKEFFMNGACFDGTNTRRGDIYDEMAAEHGVNVVRVYEISDWAGDGNDGQPVIDRLNKMGEMGMYANFAVGIPGQNALNYADENVVQNRIEVLETWIKNQGYLENPNIIMWTISNEVVSNPTSASGIACYKCIDRLAQWFHENDPMGRPTSIALAGDWTVPYVLRNCPNIDVLSINLYGDKLYSLHQRMLSYAGWKESNVPYMVSEYGTLGTWDAAVPHTSWKPSGTTQQGGLIEKTSTQKAVDYANYYKGAVKKYQGQGCIGSTVFLWGWQSHGDVPTWYAIVDHFTDWPFGGAEALAECFGAEIKNHTPVIASQADFTINDKIVTDNLTVSPGETMNAAVVASNPDGDPLTYVWRLVEDKRLSGKPNGMESLQEWKTGDVPSVSITAPSAGKYRLLAYAYDETNRKVAMASFPFLVQ